MVLPLLLYVFCSTQNCTAVCEKESKKIITCVLLRKATFHLCSYCRQMIHIKARRGNNNFVSIIKGKPISQLWYFILRTPLLALPLAIMAIDMLGWSRKTELGLIITSCSIQTTIFAHFISSTIYFYIKF